MGKRSRACEECHRLKIKCDVSGHPESACERCRRNNLDCVPATRHLQRDRINQLEDEIQELRNALREQSNSASPSLSPGNFLDDQDHNEAVLSFLDARIPPQTQQDLLNAFTCRVESAWPVIRLPKDLNQIRAKSPILLLSVLVYSFTQEAQRTELETHDELVRETMRILGDEVLGRGKRSLELVQALLVAAFWNKTTRKGQQGSCYQIVQLAADMAIDIGIAGFSLQPSPVAFFSRHEDSTSLEARRTWLACFVALSTSSISMRRPNTVPWNAHHEECVFHLESRGDLSDMLLCQIVRIIQVIEQISNHLCLCQIATFVDGSDYRAHAMMDILRNKVDVWASQIPITLSSSQTLKVWRHVAMIYIYELVLHTPTNKASFAAPFIPGRIPVHNFPKPTNIIPPLETALKAIIHDCHAVIETAAEMDPSFVLSLPTFCFAPTVIYSLYVLVTLLAAATNPENTYGQCVTRESFRIEECSFKLRSLTNRMKILDPTLSCYTTRLFDAMGWLEEWYNDYSTILRQYETNLVIQ